MGKWQVISLFAALLACSAVFGITQHLDNNHAISPITGHQSAYDSGFADGQDFLFEGENTIVLAYDCKELQYMAESKGGPPWGNTCVGYQERAIRVIEQLSPEAKRLWLPKVLKLAQKEAPHAKVDLGIPVTTND